MKTLTLMTVLILLTLGSGCRTSGGWKGGSGAEQAMMHGAFNNTVPWLKTRGFPNARKPEKYVLHPSPADQGKIYTLRSGEKQGFLRYAERILAEANSYAVWYGIPLAGPTASHEGTHMAMFLGGYDAESHSHDRRAFPSGGVVLALGVEPYFVGCPHSRQLTIYDPVEYVIPLDAKPGVPIVVETIWLDGAVVGEDQNIQVELVVIP